MALRSFIGPWNLLPGLQMTSPSWTDKLPWVFLRLWSTFKMDLHCSSVIFVFQLVGINFQVATSETQGPYKDISPFHPFWVYCHWTHGCWVCISPWTLPSSLPWSSLGAGSSFKVLRHEILGLLKLTFLSCHDQDHSVQYTDIVIYIVAFLLSYDQCLICVLKLTLHSFPCSFIRCFQFCNVICSPFVSCWLLLVTCMNPSLFKVFSQSNCLSVPSLVNGYVCATGVQFSFHKRVTIICQECAFAMYFRELLFFTAFYQLITLLCSPCWG